jgi:hypothetical protein
MQDSAPGERWAVSRRDRPAGVVFSAVESRSPAIDGVDWRSERAIRERHQPERSPQT